MKVTIMKETLERRLRGMIEDTQMSHKELSKSIPRNETNEENSDDNTLTTFID